MYRVPKINGTDEDGFFLDRVRVYWLGSKCKILCHLHAEHDTCYRQKTARQATGGDAVECGRAQ